MNHKIFTLTCNNCEQETPHTNDKEKIMTDGFRCHLCNSIQDPINTPGCSEKWHFFNFHPLQQ